MKKSNTLKHVAIIMDGNGRWARKRGLPRIEGHRRGMQRVEEIVGAAAEMGISILTLFAFSTENWMRPKKEVNTLMRFLVDFLSRQIPKMQKNNIRFMRLGQDEPLPDFVLQKLNEAKEKTRNNTGLILVLAFNYGSRQEIVEAAKNFARQVSAGQARYSDLDENKFKEFLYTKELPDPDLLIRTSGEMRISNFLLWQLSYAELYFPKKNWPDFGKRDLREALLEYDCRQRRFGRVNAEE